MLRIFHIALISMVFWPGLAPVKSAFGENTQSSEFLIPFQIEANKIIIGVRIKDSRELKVILDSGMTFSGLIFYKPQLIDSLFLDDPFEVAVGGAGSEGPVMAVMADSMSFQAGNVTFHNQGILVLQDDKLKDFPRDGIIGYSIFGHYGVEIDYQRMVIRLHDPEKLDLDSTWQSIPLTFKNNQIPWIDIVVNVDGERDIPMSVYIDLASSEALELLIFEEMKFVLPDNLEDHYLGRGLSGDINGYKGTIAALQIGSHKLTGTMAAFAPREVRSKQDNADGILGNNALRRFQSVFDYNSKILYLKPVPDLNFK